MKKIKLLVTMVLCLVLTGCSWSDTNYFGAGDSSFNIRQPYTNAEGFLTVNYDIKEVEARENDILNEFDFSGPMGSILNAQHSSSSTVITPETTTATQSVNPNLPMNSKTGFVSPLDPAEASVTITSKFGPRNPFQTDNGSWSSSNHKGVDLAVPANTPIYAVMDGTVEAAGYSSSMGNYVKIKHDDTSNGCSGSIYMHGIATPVVQQGEHVRKGQLIMYVGSTGNSTGPHLHLGVYDTNGDYTDPANFIEYNWYN